MSETKQLSQVQGVIKAVQKVLGQELVPGTNYREVLTKELRQQIVQLVTAGILDGTIRYSKRVNASKEDEIQALRRYVVSMLDNHLRKSTALNGQPRKERPKKADKPAAKEGSVIRLPRKSPTPKKRK